MPTKEPSREPTFELTEDQIRAFELIEKGLSDRDVAKTLGKKSHTRIGRWRRDATLKAAFMRHRKAHPKVQQEAEQEAHKPKREAQGKPKRAHPKVQQEAQPEAQGASLELAQHEPEDRVQRAVELAAQGTPMAEVAAELGVSRATVHRWLAQPEAQAQLELARSAVEHALRLQVGSRASDAVEVLYSIMVMPPESRFGADVLADEPGLVVSWDRLRVQAAEALVKRAFPAAGGGTVQVNTQVQTLAVGSQASEQGPAVDLLTDEQAAAIARLLAPDDAR